MVERFGGTAILTPVGLVSGTDRVAWVTRDWKTEIVINIQGDEPLVDPRSIDRLVAEMLEDELCDMATLAVKKRDQEELKNPNVVKVTFSSSGNALYFSRQALTCGPDHAFYKHIGIYGYRRNALLKFCSLRRSPLESAERLEQLRALEAGFRIKIVEVSHDTVSVDHPSDVGKVEALMGET